MLLWDKQLTMLQVCQMHSDLQTFFCSQKKENYCERCDLRMHVFNQSDWLSSSSWCNCICILASLAYVSDHLLWTTRYWSVASTMLDINAVMSTCSSHTLHHRTGIIMKISINQNDSTVCGTTPIIPELQSRVLCTTSFEPCCKLVTQHMYSISQLL